MESGEVNFLPKQTDLVDGTTLPPASHSETQVSSESLLCILEGTPSSAKLKLVYLGA